MANSIMNYKVLAIKIKSFEDTIASETATEEEKNEAKIKMSELINSIIKLPGGIDLLLKIDSSLMKNMEEN